MNLKKEAAIALTLAGLFLVTLIVTVNDSKSPFNLSNTQTAAVSGTGSGLIAHYTFDEGSGTTAGDSAGSNTGTINGATWTRGKVGSGALQFDGVDDYILIPAGSSLDQNGEMSVAAWVRPTTVAAGSMGIVVNVDPAAFGSSDYNLEINRTAGRFSTVWANTIIATDTTPLSANQWVHGVMVRSGSSGDWTVKFYVNGVLSSTDTGNTTNPAGTNEETKIGALTASAQRFSGIMDDVRIYNRPLSAGEIAQLYNVSASKFGVSPTNA